MKYNVLLALAGLTMAAGAWRTRLPHRFRPIRPKAS